MRKTVMIVEDEAAAAIEMEITKMVNQNVDRKHSGDWNLYNRERINKKLAKLSKKELNRVTAMGQTFYKVITAMDIKVHRSAFHFVAFLKDVDNKVKYV